MCISVLGPLLAQVDGGTVDLRSGHQRRLLSVLVAQARRDRVVSTDEIIETLYRDGKEPPRPRRAVATEVWRLRQAIGTGSIVTDTQGYRLDADRCDLDLARFERLVAEGSADLHDGAAERANATLTRALSLWRGTPFSEIAGFPAAEAAIVRLEELRVGAIVDRADALARTGRYGEASGALEELTTGHPTLERAWALLVECHLGTGDTDLARRAFGSAQRLLAEDGLDVGPELAAVRVRLEPAPPHAAVPAVRPRPPHPTSLVGRDRELERLVAHISSALPAGGRPIIVITGEPGIGKTALVTAAADTAAGSAGSGIRVERVRCDQRQSLPYAPLQRFTAGIQVPQATGRPADGEVLVQTVCDRIEARAAEKSGMILVVDDAHWAPPATIDVLTALAARRSSTPLAMVVTFRSSAGDRSVGSAAHRLLVEASELIELRGLDEKATAELLGVPEADRETAEQMHRLTGGNPLYIGAIKAQNRHIAPGAISGAQLGSVLDAHLHALPDRTREVLQLASVIGDRFDMRVLIAVARDMAGPDGINAVVDGLQDAARANLVGLDDSGDGEFHGRTGYFTHGLVREHIYRGMPRQSRTGVHHAVGRALQRVEPSGRVPYDLLAHHFTHAWPDCPATTVAGHLRSAAHQAQAHLDFTTAGDYYHQAIDLLAMDGTDTDHALTRHLLGAAGDTAMADGDGPRARQYFTRLRRLAAAPAFVSARLRADRGEILSFGAHPVDPAALDRLAADIASAASAPPDARPSAELAAESVAALHRHRPWQAQQILQTSQPFPSAELAESRLAIWEQLEGPDQVAAAHDLLADDSVDPARAWLRLWVSEVAAGTRALDDPPGKLADLHPAGGRGAYEMACWRVTAAASLGRLRAAARLVDATGRGLASRGSATAIANLAANLSGQRMWLAMLRGDTAGARSIALSSAPTWSLRHPVTIAQEALRSALCGEFGRARELCDEALDTMTGPEATAGDRLANVAIVGEVCVRMGHRDAVETCRELLLPRRSEHIVLYFHHYFGPVSAALGQCSIALGDFDAAVDELERGLAAAAEARAATVHAQTRLHLSAALWHRNRGDDRRRADDEHRRAHEEGSRIGLWTAGAPAWPPDRLNPRSPVASVTIPAQRAEHRDRTRTP